MPSSTPVGRALARLPSNEVNADPTASGLPGANLAQDLVNWTAQTALWGSLLSILAQSDWIGIWVPGAQKALARRVGLP